MDRSTDNAIYFEREKIKFFPICKGLERIEKTGEDGKRYSCRLLQFGKNSFTLHKGGECLVIVAESV